MSPAEKVLEAMRQLPVQERLRVVERVIHEVAESSAATASGAQVIGTWSDIAEEADAIVEDAMGARETRPWRTPGA